MKVEVKWKCLECGIKHENRNDAISCCQPSVDEVYVCGECGEDYEIDTEALICCAQSDEDIKEENPVLAFREIQKKLEENGQQRMF